MQAGGSKLGQQCRIYHAAASGQPRSINRVLSRRNGQSAHILSHLLVIAPLFIIPARIACLDELADRYTNYEKRH